MDFEKFWDYCAQNKMSEISKNALSGILGLLCAEQDVGNTKMDFQEFCRQNKASEVSKNALPGILGLLCAEQDVGNLKKCIFRNSGTRKTSELSKKCTVKNSETPVRPPDP